MVRRAGSRPSHVVVVADNPQTIDNLHSYFKRVGVDCSGTRVLGWHSPIPVGATALVLFPDDYPGKAVGEFLLTLRRARPKLFIVLVTAAPLSFSAATKPQGRTVLPLVLPRPAFGWTLLDAIRSASERPKPGRA